MGDLFAESERFSIDRDELQRRLHALSSRAIYIGGSSWKYEGWLGQIYARSLYTKRGRFSTKAFEEDCLKEYASIFSTVCGDFAFYQFPSDVFWANLFAKTPHAFKWGFKIPEQITVARWPVHPRYGALSGQDNPSFLDAELLKRNFLKALEPYRPQVGVLIFEFGASDAKAFQSAAEFIEALDRFFDSLPSGWRFAAEIRNPELLGDRYFDSLRAHDIVHVFNSWSKMPAIGEQRRLRNSLTSDMIVARALLKPGRRYAEAVRDFAPYDRVVEVNEEVREDLRELVDVAVVDGRPTFLFINNRLEGNSPTTIMAVTEPFV